ncbi:hypothetical protein [Halobaculum sp. MBLA0143]|uniref:hypothetical protein n=1 Tax=Halobaculum sp. MBLA0143 TaxID=3079933 RepID=UPI0035251E46
MTASFERRSTRVPIDGGESVELDPLDPWPSAYRGSRYSLVTEGQFDEPRLKWEHRGLAVYGDPPTGLGRAMLLAGKDGGRGSFRVTARGEVLTKVHSGSYDNVDRAPVSHGWVPVYLGRLSGAVDLGDVPTDPDAPGEGEVSVWTGPPFSHGEQWAVGTDGRLIWTWGDYRFESAFDHPELIDAYDQYRSTPGAVYITEAGHAWVNVPQDDVEPGRTDVIERAVHEWQTTAEETGDETTLRLVTRRLRATSRDDDPATGHLPIHLGHLSGFDGGTLPRAVVDDSSYFGVVGRDESVRG